MKPTAAIVPLAILGIGALGTWGLIRAEKQVELVVPAPPVAQVETFVARVEPVPIRVATQGTVEPPTETRLAAEVSGAISWVSERVETGGFVSRGQRLFRIDEADYRLAIDLATAAVASARVRLAEEQAESRLAIEELRLESRPDLETEPLASRQLRVDEARASLDASLARLANARTKLSKCTIEAPFDGRVRTRLAGVGQYVGPGTELAAIHPTHYAEVRLPVTRRDLDYLGISALAGPLDAPFRFPVSLAADVDRQRKQWQGQVVATEGEVDGRTQTSTLVARVDDPYGLAGPRDSILPVGLFVEATIRGGTREAVRIPRSALLDGDRVLVVEAGPDAGSEPGGEAGDELGLQPGGGGSSTEARAKAGRARTRPVRVERIFRETVVIAAGLVEGERVAVSPQQIPSWAGAEQGIEVRFVDRTETVRAALDRADGWTPPIPASASTSGTATATSPEVAPSAGEASERAASETTSRPPVQVGLGPSDDPSHGPAPARLEALAVVDGETLRASLSGPVEIRRHRLSGPERFVVDLHGVEHRADRSALSLAHPEVLGVRVGQYRSAPEWVTRIVIDLARPGYRPEVERVPEGLVIRLPTSATGGSGESDPGGAGYDGGRP